MADVTIYGIKNCNTMKKIFGWFDRNDVAYDFHDYKKQGIDEAVIKNAIDSFGWEKVINTRGMTWRKVDQSVKDTMGNEKALGFAAEKPSAIKRPLIVSGKDMIFGFDEDALQSLLG